MDSIAQVKKLFFDSKAVTDSVDRATRKVLSKFGAFVRRGAKSSIRPRKAISQPGSPPSSHKGTLKRLIFFAYDPDRKSVVIGPTPFNTSVGIAPPLLEYGGTTVVKRRGKVKAVTYAPRPFMGPAFEKEKPKLPSMWADSVK
ncbi:MAG: hypothetical protein NT031_00110 [Planctomycetota bacterium]|nr:hypothetical protein [Planctomycetota bacterium]